jgi:hypothetical protein
MRMHDLIKLYLFALRSGDRPLARVLARALRSEAPLREHADASLQGGPQGPASWFGSRLGFGAVLTRVRSDR